MADAEPEQEARRIETDPRLDRVEEVVDRFLLPAFPADQFVAMGLQAEDVRRPVQPAQLDKLDDALLAEPIDVHRPARDEMLNRSIRCAGQIRPPVQRTSTSPSSATASELHIGQWSGNT